MIEGYATIKEIAETGLFQGTLKSQETVGLQLENIKIGETSRIMNEINIIGHSDDI